MSIKFQPLGNRILVKPVESASKVGRIFIPEQAQEKPREGFIFRMGPGKRNEAGKLIPLDFKEGDRILFGKYGGTEIKIDGQTFNMVHCDDVLAIVD